MVRSPSCQPVHKFNRFAVMGLLPMKLAVVKWRVRPRALNETIPFPLVLSDKWNFDSPLVPLGRISERVAVGEQPLTSASPCLPVTPLPFAMYHT
jgi:hypothetical protein